MPKMKTRRAAAKRFKKTGTGEFKRAKALKAIFLNINLLPARETCVRLHLFTKLIMNA